MPDGAEQTVLGAIQLVLERKGARGVKPSLEARLAEDLELDSLDLAEVSAALEDELGRDPYTDGIVPETVGEIVAYYDA